jgi:hypothetical protein
MKLKAIKIKEGYSVKELGGEFCIVFESDSNEGAVDGLPSINEAGIFLWDRIMKGFGPDELVVALTEKNQTDSEDAQVDVEEFLAKLINGNIVDIIK